MVLFLTRTDVESDFIGVKKELFLKILKRFKDYTANAFYILIVSVRLHTKMTVVRSRSRSRLQDAAIDCCRGQRRAWRRVVEAQRQPPVRSSQVTSPPGLLRICSLQFSNTRFYTNRFRLQQLPDISIALRILSQHGRRCGRRIFHLRHRSSSPFHHQRSCAACKMRRWSPISR